MLEKENNERNKMEYTIETARKLLNDAELFYGRDEDGENEEEKAWGEQRLNQNDVWAWATAMCEHVSDEELVPLAQLFWRYGWCGVLYWVSERNKHMRSEFEDNNRFIDFVRHEEQLRKDIPDDNQRAYHKLEYKLGSNPKMEK